MCITPTRVLIHRHKEPIPRKERRGRETPKTRDTVSKKKIVLLDDLLEWNRSMLVDKAGGGKDANTRGHLQTPDIVSNDGTKRSWLSERQPRTEMATIRVSEETLVLHADHGIETSGAQETRLEECHHPPCLLL